MVCLTRENNGEENRARHGARLQDTLTKQIITLYRINSRMLLLRPPFQSPFSNPMLSFSLSLVVVPCVGVLVSAKDVQQQNAIAPHGGEVDCGSAHMATMAAASIASINREGERRNRSGVQFNLFLDSSMYPKRDGGLRAGNTMEDILCLFLVRTRPDSQCAGSVRTYECVSSGELFQLKAVYMLRM